VRQALQILATEGIIEMIPNRGAFVLEFHINELKDIFVIRTQYEVQIARWAAVRADEDDLAKLEEIMAFSEFYTKNAEVQKVKNLNEDFHKALHEAAHISLLSAAIGTLSSIMYISPLTEMYSEETLDEILVEHGIISEAIFDRDEKAAALSMHSHFKKGYLRAFGEEMPDVLLN
jgi:DNA-binding GntR family transcriptional regulator